MADLSEYEALVRQQLSELGYNSDAIPDEVCTSAHPHPYSYSLNRRQASTHSCETSNPSIAM